MKKEKSVRQIDWMVLIFFTIIKYKILNIIAKWIYLIKLNLFFLSVMMLIL